MDHIFKSIQISKKANEIINQVEKNAQVIEFCINIWRNPSHKLIITNKLSIVKRIEIWI